LVTRGRSMSLDHFRDSLFEEVRQLIVAADAEGRAREVIRAGLERLLSPEEEEREQQALLTEREAIVYDLYRGLEEIEETHRHLKDIEIYIRRFPYGDTDISRVRHLGYHIGNFLGEVYILKERLIAYLNKIKKLHRADRRRLLVERRLEPIYQYVSNSLENIVAVRGGHVHDLRYVDEDIHKLTMFELILEGASGEEWEVYFEHSFDMDYQQVRRKWRGKIKQIDSDLSDLLDNYFKMLHFTIFDENDNLIYPA